MPRRATQPGAQSSLSAPERFNCTAVIGGSSAWVHLTGELDSTAALQLERQLDVALTQARTVVLDIRALASIDSAGLRVILRASEQATAVGASLVMIRDPDHVHPVFELTGTGSELLTFEPGARRARCERKDDS